MVSLQALVESYHSNICLVWLGKTLYLVY